MHLNMELCIRAADGAQCGEPLFKRVLRRDDLNTVPENNGVHFFCERTHAEYLPRMHWIEMQVSILFVARIRPCGGNDVELSYCRSVHAHTRANRAV